MAKIKGMAWAIGLFLGVILVFTIAGNLIPTATVTGDALGTDNQGNCQAVGCYWNESGTDQCVNTSTAPSGDCAVTPPTLPLASLFGSSGIVFILISIALLLFVLARAKMKK